MSLAKHNIQLIMSTSCKRGVYAHFDDNGNTTADATDIYQRDLICMDFGSDEKDASMALVDLSDFRIQLSVSNSEILTAVKIKLYGSDDDSTYTDIADIYEKTIGADSLDETVTSVEVDTFTETTYRYYKIVFEISYPVATEGETITWDIDGKILNLYLGDYLELPCPELPSFDFITETVINKSYGGIQSGYSSHDMLKGVNYTVKDVDDDKLTEWGNFIDYIKGGALPFYAYEENTWALSQVYLTSRTAPQRNGYDNHTIGFSLTEAI